MGCCLSSHYPLKRIRNKIIKVNIKPSRKIIFQTACSFYHGWSGNTYIARVHLGSTTFPALMVCYLSSHCQLKTIQNKTIKVNIKPSRKIFPNGMQFSLWLECQHLRIENLHRLDSIPSSDGMVPVKSLSTKKDSKQNHQSQHQTLKKNYFPNGMQFSSWLEWHHLHR